MSLSTTMTPNAPDQIVIDAVYLGVLVAVLSFLFAITFQSKIAQKLSSNPNVKKEWTRPPGLVLISLWWIVQSSLGLLASARHLGLSFLILTYSQRLVAFPEATTFAMLTILLFLTSFVQFVTVYGILKGLSWSYSTSRGIAILNLLINCAYVQLIYSTQITSDLRSPALAQSLVASMISTVLLMGYLTRPRVWEYLHRW